MLRMGVTSLGRVSGMQLPATRLGNPAHFVEAGTPWLCDPASRRVCLCRGRCLGRLENLFDCDLG